MKRFMFVILAITTVAVVSGCGKKEQPMEQAQEQMSMEDLTKMNVTTAAVPEEKGKAVPAPVAPAASVQPEASPKLEPLPPSGPYKPAVEEIQTALKNAGFYTGRVDGKVGPKTKKAIEEFQKSVGLKADGKVGPKTWALLSKHLNAAAPSAQPAKR